MLNGKTVVLGITGGIAAYKAAALCSRLKQAGADVRVIMTESATKFISPLTLQTLSRRPVAVDTFDERDAAVVQHIDLADSADLVVVAPATANCLAKLAHGLADDMLSTTLLATEAPILIAPAMNVHMYAHPATQANMAILRERGVAFVEPGEGQLACGYVGKGRLAEPEEIFAAVAARLNRSEEKPLRGKRVLVTAGGTVERIDPVRYITNDSSGKMGIALARAAAELGAEVTLVRARTSVPDPDGMAVVKAMSALEMLDAVTGRLDDADIVIMTAAIADYRPAEQADRKMKKKDEVMELRLVKNPDILQTIGERKGGRFIVGFAAETDSLDEHARDKIRRKKCDLLAANDVSRAGTGFGADANAVRVYDAEGLALDIPVLPKDEVARRLLRLVVERLHRQAGGTEGDKAE